MRLRIRGCLGKPRVRLLLALGAIALSTSAASAQSGDTASPSNATNFQGGGQVSVNERTAAISFQTSLFELPGIVDGIGGKLTLSYRQEDAISNTASQTRYFGMPYGWFFDISFIVNNGTYTSIYLDGAEAYVTDASWRTLFTPTGSTDSIPIATGLKQYNRADANLQSDAGTVTVNGISSAYVFAQLGGMVRYFSGNGLLLQESDRFGNTLQYHYNNDTTPQNALIEEIVDSWGNSTTFSYCGDGDSNCESGQVTVTLPDGRTVGWVAPDNSRLTKIIDPLGMVTALQWSTSPCKDDSEVVTAITLPTGAAMAVSYTCMDVCTASSTSSCLTDGNLTTWPVVDTLYQCPSIGSGDVCPTGYDGDDYLTTTYQLGTSDSTNNYSGFPLYSPYASVDSGEDALMASNDDTFTYTTVVQRKTTSGTVHDQTETDYNFLHLETENRVYVRAQQSNGLYGLSLAKEVSYCYDLSSSDAGVDCSSTKADYQQLPANYQQAVYTGSCVYNVGSGADSSQARHSVLAYTYDSFGNTLNAKTYHATDSTGIISDCSRTTRLGTSGLKLVRDVYKAYDTPTSASENGFVDLSGSGDHFGLPTGAETFVYLDDDESGVGAHATIADTSSPVLVTLMCHTLTSSGDPVGAGKAIATTTKGLLSTGASAPSTAGVLSECGAPGWDSSVAPPKTTSVTYESNGRMLSQAVAWADGFTGQGISSATQSFAYALTSINDGEESCSGSGVLQITTTDADGYNSIQRSCVLNGFALSSSDASGNTTFMEHAANGMTTKTTNPNGTYVTSDYYYACPTAQDGSTKTCPSTSTALTDCPYDDAEEPRNCQVHTMQAGSDPDSGAAQSSYVDGVLTASIHDGLGRNVLSKDNLGGASGSGFTTVQTRSSMTYDSLGQLSARTSEIGASNALVYQTTVELDEKLRPKLVCGPRGNAHEFVHDDVTQTQRLLFNGNSTSSHDLNDSGKLSAIASCALTAEQTTTGDTCPTVASDPSSTDCPGDGYFSYTLHDGDGLEHSVTASSGSTLDDGASLTSVNGVSVFSADRLQYGYSVTSKSSDGSTLSASSSKVRDLHGKSVLSSLSVDTSDGSSTTVQTDTNVFDARGLLTESDNLLADSKGNPLSEGFTYAPTGLLETSTSYAGVTFHTYYDEMNRKVRYCFASEGGGSEGERFDRDPITGEMLTITHFTNASDCSECSDGNCGDVDGESIQYTYTPFGALESITYSDGTTLQWAYDQYQRLACQADALATSSGKSCPASPVDADFSPSADDLLLTYTYWDDGDSYRRGLLKSMCRGMYDATSNGYVTKCIDKDYYTPVEVGGSSVSSLATVVGAYSGSMKTETLCTGGSCFDGSGSIVYQTTYLYDAHGRAGSVKSVNASGAVILASLYEYDQYDNVVHEQNSSDLDTSEDSNYQMDYGYDGLLRLVSEQRSDSSGNLLESTTYEYDAGDNLIRKVQQVMATETPTAEPTGAEATSTPTIEIAGPDPTSTPSAAPTLGGEETPTLEPQPTSTPSVEPTMPEATATIGEATRTPTESKSLTNVDDDGCFIDPAARPSWSWLVSMLLAGALLVWRRLNTVGSPTTAPADSHSA